MMTQGLPPVDRAALFAAALWYRADQGTRYEQLARHIARSIADGRLPAGQQLPPERDLADLTGLSRVTVRKAVAQLVTDGLIEQRRGAGTFVRHSGENAGEKLEQSLSSLTSFTDYMLARGKASSSVGLARGLFVPAPEEMIALGIPSTERVARIERLRSADGVPVAIERSSLPYDILPDPDDVDTSLYAVLRLRGGAPTRAIQRITATNLAPREADMLHLPVGTAVLRIDRTGYLPSGRPIEFTRGLYHSDIYDFVAELRLDGT